MLSVILITILIIAININSLSCKPSHIINDDLEYKFTRDMAENNEYQFQNRVARPEDDIQAEEKGTLKKTSEGKEVLTVNGSFSYNPACDHTVFVRYTADENGYKPHVSQSTLRQLVKKDGKIVGFMSVCSLKAYPPVGAACIASLQGGCIGK
ncbi:hypothetical protein ILUMI_21237 [Ignelater luminosus]|uniref:Uncharacterized protein n=1 Tax=Ignelater luminosus TaxID=2038154 RepID=A0A8K0CCL1_IGNLU|nr:hypothetical protein ILUMI_21237 [Ignelater luminosus]